VAVDVAAGEGFGGDNGPIVVRSALDEGIERRLGRATVLADAVAEGSVMPFDRLFAGRDEGLPGAAASMGGRARMGVPTRILAHREAQEIEAHPAFVGMQGVRDAGLRGVQLEPYRGQEGSHRRVCRFDRVAAVVQDDEVISLCRLPGYADPGGEAQRASQDAVGIIQRPLSGVRCSSLLWCPPIVARDQPQAGGRHAHGLLEGETMSGSGESDDDRQPAGLCRPRPSCPSGPAGAVGIT
jgi:hypothetical protein